MVYRRAPRCYVIPVYGSVLVCETLSVVSVGMTLLRERRAGYQHGDDVSRPRVTAVRGESSIRAGIGLEEATHCGIKGARRLLFDRCMG